MNTRAMRAWTIIVLFGLLASACGAPPSSNAPTVSAVSTDSSVIPSQSSPSVVTSLPQTPTSKIEGTPSTSSTPTARPNVSFQSAPWQPVGPQGLPPRTGIQQLLILSTQPTTLLVAIYEPSGAATGVYRSTDEGVTWKRSVGLPTGSSGFKTLITPPGSPTTVYAVLQSPALGEPLEPVYRSIDSGTTWKAVKLPSFGSNANLADVYSNTELVAVPQPERLFLTSRIQLSPEEAWQLYESVDDGATWTKPIIPEGVKKVRSVVVDPLDPNISLMLGNLGFVSGSGDGMYRSTDGGKTWAIAQRGIPNNQTIWQLIALPTQPTTLLAAADGSLQSKQPFGFESDMYQSTDGGASWSQAYVGPYGILSRDPTAPETVYVTGLGGLFRSHDGGRTWELINSNPPVIEGGRSSSPQVDPNKPTRLYVHVASDVFKIEGQEGSP